MKITDLMLDRLQSFRLGQPVARATVRRLETLGLLNQGDLTEFGADYLTGRRGTERQRRLWRGVWRR